jgi:predicted nucleic acid-binding protein
VKRINPYLLLLSIPLVAASVLATNVWAQGSAGEPGRSSGKPNPLNNLGRIAGPRVHDARIAALCLVHGVRELWTADRDFSRFPSLATSNPLTG